MNQVQIIGRLTADVELKYTDGGTAVTTVSVAVDRVPKDKGADFPRVKVFGKTAEALSRHTKKGSLIGVAGRIETGSYKNKNGDTVYTTDIIANNIDFLSWEHTKGTVKDEEPGDGDYTAPDDFSSIDGSLPF